MAVSLSWLADSISCIRRVNFSHRTEGLTLDFLRKNGNFTHLFQSARYTRTPTCRKRCMAASSSHVPPLHFGRLVGWCHRGSAPQLLRDDWLVRFPSEQRPWAGRRDWQAAPTNGCTRLATLALSGCGDAQALTLQHNLSRFTGSLFLHKAHFFMELCA